MKNLAVLKFIVTVYKEQRRNQRRNQAREDARAADGTVAN